MSITKHYSPLITLIAAVLGGLAAAAGLSAQNVTIRLPSGGGAADGWEVPPWKCCDLPVCDSSSIPPSCFCADLVGSCDGCRNCSKPVQPDPPRYLCSDWYRTYPPPACASRLERPWACCDDPKCTTTCPTICACDDAVESCAAACSECVQVGDDPRRYRCLDEFAGSPWPRCST